MNPRLLLSLLSLLFATSPAFAGRYGSETVVTLSGTYHLAGTQTDKRLKGGDVSKTAAYKIQKVTNLTLLSALKKRSLIATTDGYSIVMVGQTHTADGIKFFATASGKTPVEIPADLLSLTLNDGPVSGTAVVDKNNKLKTVATETRNHAWLTVGSFSGSGIVIQSWTSKPVVKSGITEIVELMESKGKISGVVSSSTNSGVGVIDFSLTNSKAVDLKRYGMNTTSTSSYSGGVTIVTTPSTSAPIPDIIPASLGASAQLVNVGSGTLTLNASNTLTGTTLSPNGILWVNPASSSSADLGLTLAFDGTMVPLLGQPNELTITTTEGPVVFTRENGNIWTLVAPATPAAP